MKTWLSGMSPVAADAASPLSADGPEDVAGVVAVVFAPVVAGVAVVAGGATACLEPPQPARRAAQPATTSASLRIGPPWSRQPPDCGLNAGLAARNRVQVAQADEDRATPRRSPGDRRRCARDAGAPDGSLRRDHPAHEVPLPGLPARARRRLGATCLPRSGRPDGPAPLGLLAQGRARRPGRRPTGHRYRSEGVAAARGDHVG